MTSKKCTNCRELKLLIEFNKDSAKTDGRRCVCRTCISEIDAEYRRTKDGLIAHIYGAQKASSRHRNHAAPEYAREQLREWVFNQDNFEELYNNWVASGYQKMMKPSCDRLDDYQGYSLDNLRLVTWQDNFDKSLKDRKDGINNKQNRPVIQMGINGTFIADHHSMSHAGRVAATSMGNIVSCCNGKRKTAGSFRWMYSIGIPIANNLNIYKLT